MKDLLTQLQHICNELKDECENAIIRKYNQNAKQYTFALMRKCNMFLKSCILSFYLTYV